MTIGDVLAVIAAVFALGATWIATLLLFTLAFPARTRRAQQALLASPGRCGARGLGALIVVGLSAASLGNHPSGPVQILAWAFWSGLGALGALGSAGAAQIVGSRIQEVGVRMSPFASLTRGTVLYVLAGFLPVIGWFLVTPAALLLSLGSGMTALGKTTRTPDASLHEISARAEQAGAGA